MDQFINIKMITCCAHPDMTLDIARTLNKYYLIAIYLHNATDQIYMGLYLFDTLRLNIFIYIFIHCIQKFTPYYSNLIWRLAKKIKYHLAFQN